MEVKDVERAAVTGGGGGGNRRLRPDVSRLLRSKKVAALSKLLLGLTLRFTAFMFCLVSFSVLAADRERGWAKDSFYLYKEFRLNCLKLECFGVNARIATLLMLATLLLVFLLSIA